MIKGKKILVVLPVSEGQKERLEEFADKSCFTYTSYKKATKKMAEEADIIIGNIVIRINRYTYRIWNGFS